ncbi:MAG: discoidin domain-containing protein [Oscillospiraceae bacterium]|nr:discoidin domain-containing protein [Oscillospiraceae bacterium]
MNEFLNDANIIAELEQRVKDFEQEIKDFEQKRRDLEQERRDLEQKRRDLDQLREDGGYIPDYDAQISDINFSIGKVSSAISEITAQILEKGEKIKSIGDEILNTPGHPGFPGGLGKMINNFENFAEGFAGKFEEFAEGFAGKIENFAENFADKFEKKAENIDKKFSSISYAESDYDRKMRSFDEQIEECERKIEEKEREIEQSNEKKDREINNLENKKARLESTRDEIENKMSGDINDATRERLEEMRDEVDEKIGETEDQIGEVEDERNDREEELNDEIQELHDRIEEINEEREEYENEYVDEDLIGEIKNLPGFDNKAEQFETHEEPEEINVEIIDEIGKKYAGISSEMREQRRKYRRESKYNVNFCSGAAVDSFCCFHNDEERPENLINGSLQNKWGTVGSHNIEIGHPHWIVIDLGETAEFNYVQLIKCSEGRGNWADSGNRGHDMSAWRIEVCVNQLDKTNNVWKEFNRETEEKSAVYEKQFETVSGRYVRLLIDAAEQNPEHKHGHARLYGFKIKLRNEVGEDLKDYTKKASIDSFCHYNRNERPEFVLNDNMKQKWCASDSHVEHIPMPHWIIIDLGENKTFNRLRIVKASEGEDKRDYGQKGYDMSAWRLEASEDKENWVGFNSETNDQSAVYIKSFEPVSGRYVRLLVDAAEHDPNNKNGHVRLYDLRLEMLSEKLEDKTVTFDDILAIAPFAKKETIDKLADKLTDIDDFAKIKEVGKFLSPGAADKLLLKAFEKDDFNAVFALAPYAPRETIEKIALELDSELEFDKIKALTPFLGKEAIAGIIISGGNLDMKKLRELAPFLGSALIDEIVQRMF